MIIRPTPMQSHGLYWMRDINWPAGFDEWNSNCSVHVLLCVWFQMSCSVWSSTSLCGKLNLPTRSYDNKLNCSKHDVTMVSGSQATVRTCYECNDSNVRSFFSRWERPNTLLSLTVIMEVLVECIIEQRVRFWWSILKKTQKLAELYCRTSNI